MSGTPSQNTWMTKGRESLWKPRVEPGKEGTPNQSLREAKVEQGRARRGKWKKRTLKYPYLGFRVENREI
jgi:hypothetical protein